MGWTPLCELEGIVVTRLVTLFYANLEMLQPNDRVYTLLFSYVDGKHIEFSEEILLEVLGIQNDGPRVYASKNNPTIDS